MRRIIIFLLSMTVLSLLSCAERSETAVQMPSDIRSRVMDSVIAHVWKGDVAGYDGFNAYRNGFAKMFIDSMRAKDLDVDETIAYAEVLHWSGRSGDAEKLLAPLAARDDDVAREAFRDLILIKSETGRLEEAERLLREYRRRFPANPEGGLSLYTCVDDVVTRYNDADRPADAARVILDELDSLPFDYPYRSFGLIGDLVPLMAELDRLPELRERAARYRTRFEESLNAHLSAPAPDDSTRERYDKIAQLLERRVRSLGDLLSRIDMIGRKAPELSFLHVYNAEPATTFAMMQGKVTVLDFWATWCISCVIGYRELGNLYVDYKERGVAIVGVTNLQGQYRDGDSARDEGSEDEPLAEEREIELTRSYIEKHRIAWPCGVSSTPVADTGYKAQGLPTYVILDRDGVIRYVQVGIGKERQMRRVIEKLLNERA